LLNPYQTADGRWILLVAAQTKDWPVFASAIGREDLVEDARFSNENRLANAAALVKILDPIFASHPLDHWKDLLTRNRVIFGVVQVAQEIIDDPQLEANDIVVPLEIEGRPRSRTVSNPIQVVGSPKVPAGAAPRLGEHGREVLRELAFGEEEIDGFLACGTVGMGTDDPGKPMIHHT
jgi:crotonobetainyl-CoA:carnitine CoA-transferase CaiB-like acyl-CoA transferase